MKTHYHTQRHKQTDRQRQTDRQTDRQIDKQTDIQTDRQRHSSQSKQEQCSYNSVSVSPLFPSPFSFSDLFPWFTSI